MFQSRSGVNSTLILPKCSNSLLKCHTQSRSLTLFPTPSYRQTEHSSDRFISSCPSKSDPRRFLPLPPPLPHSHQPPSALPKPPHFHSPLARDIGFEMYKSSTAPRAPL